jgi:hypothetical protein
VSARRRGGFKLALAASVALAASAVVLYEAVYLPFRESRLAEERLREREQAEARKRAEAMRLLAQQQDAGDRQAAQNAAAQARYQSCFGTATAAHDSAWAAECKRRANQIRQNHDDCLAKLKLPQSYCDTAYVSGDASPQCTLPGEIATVIDADLERARNRCLRESQAAQP